MNQEETSIAVRHLLDERGIHYEYSAERECLATGIQLRGKLKRVTVFIQFLDDGYVMYGISPIKAEDDEGLGEVVKYMTLINYGLVPGNFEVDARDGEIRFKVWTRTKGAERLSGEVIDDGLQQVHGAFERFGDGFAVLAMGFSDAETEYKKAMGGDE